MNIPKTLQFRSSNSAHEVFEEARKTRNSEAQVVINPKPQTPYDVAEGQNPWLSYCRG